MTFKKASLIILLCLCALLLFSSCNQIQPDLTDKQADMTMLMDSIIAQDEDAAIMVMKHVPISNQAQFDAFWGELLRIYDGASTYEIQFVSWNTTYSYTNQTSVTTVTYRVKADTKATAEFVLTYNDSNQLKGVNVTDVTEKNTPVIIAVRIILIIWFMACVTLGIWMTVDCIKRPIRFKVLWIILIWCSVLLHFGLVGTSLKFNFTFGLISAWGTIHATASSFLLRIPVPVGSLIYLAVRKKLKLKTNKKAEEQQMEAIISDLESELIDQTAQESQEMPSAQDTPFQENESSEQGQESSDQEDE